MVLTGSNASDALYQYIRKRFTVVWLLHPAAYADTDRRGRFGQVYGCRGLCSTRLYLVIIRH